MKFRIIVSAIIEKEGKYLFCQKPKDVGPYPNTWHLVGGGVDMENESVEEALRREIREETSLEVDNVERLGFDEDTTTNKHGEMTHYVFLIHHVQYKSGEVVPNDDIVEAQWFEKEALKSMPLTTPSKRLFKKLAWI